MLKQTIYLQKMGILGPLFNFRDQVTGKIIDDSELEHLCSLKSVIVTIINHKPVGGARVNKPSVWSCVPEPHSSGPYFSAANST